MKFQENLVNRILVADMEDLKTLPSEEEIKQAMWDCESNRAPSPDGYNFNFLRKCWGTLVMNLLSMWLIFSGWGVYQDEQI